MKEKIIEMLKMQEALDKSFMEYMGRTKPLTVEEVQKALFDECGEVNHEMKSEWCYWKKSQKQVDRDKLKEELSDVWHFSLTYHRLLKGIEFDNGMLFIIRKILKESEENIDWFYLLQSVPARTDDALYYTILLTEKLGFTFDEMYEAYIEKNKVNYQRMKGGY